MNEDKILDAVVNYIERRIAIEPIEDAKKAFQEILIHIEVLKDVCKEGGEKNE